LVLPHGFWNAQQPKHPVLGNAQQLALGRKLMHTDVKFRDATLASLAFLLLLFITRFKGAVWIAILTMMLV
jgi:hypothetical protein